MGGEGKRGGVRLVLRERRGIYNRKGSVCGRRGEREGEVCGVIKRRKMGYGGCVGFGKEGREGG